MTPSLSISVATILLFCVSFTFLCPLFYWLLTDARPNSMARPSSR